MANQIEPTMISISFEVPIALARDPDYVAFAGVVAAIRAIEGQELRERAVRAAAILHRLRIGDAG